MNDATNQTSVGENGEEYKALMLLDDLESLLEELEESGAEGYDQPILTERMHALDLTDMADLRERIGILHERLDAEDNS